MKSPRPDRRGRLPLALLPLVLALDARARATPTPVTVTVRGQVIEGTLRHLQAAYVDPEVVSRMASAVHEKQRSGACDGLLTAETLCQQLTTDLRAVSKDRRLRFFDAPDLGDARAEAAMSLLGNRDALVVSRDTFWGGAEFANNI